MKKSKIFNKIFISLICSIITVSLLVPVRLKAEVDSSDICDLILKKQYVYLDPQLISDALEGDIWGVFQDIYNGTMSYKTWKDTVHACEVDPDNSHGGHGGSLPSPNSNKVWYTVLNDTEDDQKNGSNYNYYTNSYYSSTNNYSVVNTTTNNISYNYENTAYNYYYDVYNSYYDITNNSYNYYLSQNNYLTTVNNYNNTTIIDNGSTRVLYYRLPDGSNSLNMTEEIALNGYKTSLSVRSYENTYDSDDLVALYHFDGNELDSAYPTQTTLEFTRNSIQYIGSTTPFNESLSLYGESEISVNKSNKFVSFRFDPIFNQNWSLSINGSDLGSAVLDYETFTHYDEFYNNYFIQGNVNFNIFKVTDSLYFGYYSNNLPSSGYSGDKSIIFGSSIENVVDYSNSQLSPSRWPTPLYVFDNPSLFETTSRTYNITSSSVINNFYNPENIDLSSYAISNGYQFITSEDYTVKTYESNQKVSNRSYNYVNQFYIDTESAVDLVNFNMWNYLTVNIDGSVYINGNDTNIDIDNTKNLSIEIGGDTVTYIDELALFNSDHNNYSPFYPYSSNIVYSVPEYYEYLEVPGIKINQLVDNSNIIRNNVNSIYSYGNCILNGNMNSVPQYSQLVIGKNISIDRSHKYYIYFDQNDYSMGLAGFMYISQSGYLPITGSGTWNAGAYLNVDQIVNFDNYSFNYFIIDVTLMFGSGYEPSEEWLRNNLTNYISYNINPDVTESPYNIETGYEYLKQVPTGLAKNNEILIQSIIPVSSWKIGGYRSSDPSNGDVFANVDDLGYITSVQQYNGLDWVEVTAGLYNEYMEMWISALGFNIFNQNWEYTEYKYLNDGGSNNMIIRFLSDQFNNLKSWIQGISMNSVLNVNNDYYNDQDTVINNSNEVTNISNNIQEIENNIFNDFDSAANNIELKPLESFGTEFNQSTGWVKEQFDNFIYYEAEEGETERELNPVGFILLFSLSIGLVLLIIGKRA